MAHLSLSTYYRGLDEEHAVLLRNLVHIPGIMCDKQGY
jgi:hypothetical protein